MQKVKKFEPTQDRMLVLPDVLAEKSEGGIILPQIRDEPTLRGTVVESGPGRWEFGVHIPNSAKKGDRILFIRNFNSPEIELEVDGQKMLVLRDGNVMGIVD